jgi:pSer/pThr/pTyr-binding forkhead associated (FHA) protein
MNICPICLFVNSATSEACTRCKKFRFDGGPAVAVAEQRSPSHANVGTPPPMNMNDPASATKADGSNCIMTKPSAALKSIMMMRPLPPSVEPSFHEHPSTPISDSTKPTRTILKPKLEVVRGERTGATFSVLEGKNIVGRTVHSPVDIDLTGQEPIERVWTSRNHACLQFDGRTVLIEDMSSLNGTFVNRTRIFPGQQRVLHPNDVVQVGTVQLRLLVSAEKVEV